MQLQIASNVQSFTSASRFNRPTRERDLRKLLDVEKIWSAKVLVPLFRLRVQARRIDHKLKSRGSRILHVYREFAAVFSEHSVSVAVTEVRSREDHRGVLVVEHIIRCGGLRRLHRNK